METVKVQTPPCPLCGQTTILKVRKNGLMEWRSGQLIQKAFPELSKTTRELLMTGTHDHCWDEMFKEED